jgi:hypothetical protein
MEDRDNPSSSTAAPGNGRATDLHGSSPSEGSAAPPAADQEAAGNRPKAKAWKRPARSRLTDGRTLLPGVPSQSTWARLFRDMNEIMLEHVGGADQASEPQQLAVRRVALLETELRFQERKIAQIRAAGGEPDDALLDLYSRISNTQRRHLDALGWTRVPKDVTPDLRTYLAAKKTDD